MPTKPHSKDTNPVGHTQCAVDLDALQRDSRRSIDAPSQNSPQD